MNQPAERLRLRKGLFAIGFFDHDENQKYWKLLEKSKVDPPEAEDFAKAVYLFNESILKKGIVH